MAIRKVKFESDKSAGTTVKTACGKCGENVNHAVLKSIEEIGTENYGHGHSFDWHVSSQIIQCNGCEEITFRSVSTNSEDYDEEIGSIPTEKLYPDRGSGRRTLNDAYLLPNDLQNIYNETTKALAHQPILAGVGIRSIIETVTKDKNAKGNDLEKKIDDLVIQGVLTKVGAGILHKLRILGNQAAHEVKAHKSTELQLAMDVIEHLLEDVYLIPARAERTFNK